MNKYVCKTINTTKLETMAATTEAAGNTKTNASIITNVTARIASKPSTTFRIIQNRRFLVSFAAERIALIGVPFGNETMYIAGNHEHSQYNVRNNNIPATSDPIIISKPEPARAMANIDDPMATGINGNKNSTITIVAGTTREEPSK